VVHYSMNMKMEFKEITAYDDERSETITGIYEMADVPDDDQIQMITTIDMLVKDNNTQKTYKIYDMVGRIYQDAEYGIAQELEGRFYHHDYGYMDIYTVERLKIQPGDTHPSEGEYLMEGVNGTEANVSFIDNETLRVRADTNGNGVYDYDSGHIHWRSLIEGDGNNDNGNADEPNGKTDSPVDGDKTNSIGMTFNYIEPGTFLMGSPEDEPGRRPDETQHEVTLTEGYYMQTTPVTQGQWEAVMGYNPSHFDDCGDDCPVAPLTWDDVQDFITALNALEGTTRYALPTEAQWEYAARAGSTTAFANGPITETGSGYDPVLDSMGWYAYNSKNRTHPVGQKDPNAWGLYDMHGNVWEWVADWYGNYPSSAVVDPTGPESGTERVFRGGIYGIGAKYCRSAYRLIHYPDGGGHFFAGFRLVLLQGH